MASAIAPDHMADSEARGDREADAYVALSVAGIDCPIGPWVYSHPAWNDARLTGAFMRLMLAAWNSTPAGSLPTDVAQLVPIARLPHETFVAHQSVLMSGWDVAQDRFWFAPLADRARHLVMEHGKTIRLLQTEVSVASIAPGAFQLRAVEPVQKRARKSKLPADFTLHEDLVVWGASYLQQTCERQAATGVPGSQEVVRVLTEIMADFKTHAKAKSYSYDDWDAAFKSFVKRQTNGEFGLASNYFPALFPNQPVERVAMAPRAGYVPAAQMVREGLDSSVDDALRRMGLGSVSTMRRAQNDDHRTIDAEVVDVDAPLARPS